MSYQGSKSKVIDKIARFFPNADNFYDLFGGGFSVSHYMLKHRSKSYKNFHFNELRPGVCELIQAAIAGKYSYDVFKPEWISRERFFAEKDSSAYIKIVWSFGNNGRGYIFGKEIENQKRSMHQAIVFCEFDDFMKGSLKLEKWPNHLTITGRRLYLKMLVRNEKRLDLQQLGRLEQLEQLERLQQLERIQQPSFTTLDYRQVKINNNSVVYCDIPYLGTVDYQSNFSHNDFFEWAANQNNPVFVSEYEIKDSRFYLLKEFTHRSSFSAIANIPVTERLYGNKLAFDIIQNARQL